MASNTWKTWSKALAAGCALAALSLAACSPKAPEAPAAAAKVDWPGLIKDWIEDDFAANPSFAAYEGDHKFDGLQPDFSDAGLKTEINRLKLWKAKATSVDPAQLTDPQKFERDYLIATVDMRLFWIEASDWPHKSPAYYTSFPTGNLDPAVYLDRDYADAPTRMKAFIKWCSNIPKAAEQIKANLKGPLARPQIDIGVNSFGPMGEFVKTDAKTVFKGVGSAEDQAELDKQTAAAAAAFADLTTYLKSLQATQVEDFAMGPKLYAQMLYDTERVDTPLDKLEAMGEADLKRNQAALVEACKTYAPGKTIPQCIDKEEASKPTGGTVAYATQQLIDLRKFVIEHNVATVPGDSNAFVKQSPPYNSQNGAYIDPPAPFEATPKAYYNIAAPDPKWTAKQRNDYIPGKANLLFTSVHEVWPGHFLQFLHSNQSDSKFGQVYVGYAFAEGWAHYGEEMMWEMGLGNGDVETHIGQLTNATLRNVRLLSSIRMHTKGMTLAQSKEMFIKEGYQSEKTAEQQAARGAYDPGYLNYNMGKLMIRKLSADWCAINGGSEDHACWKKFHDAFLSFGGPPIPLVRGAMMKTAAKAEF